MTNGSLLSNEWLLYLSYSIRRMTIVIHLNILNSSIYIAHCNMTLQHDTATLQCHDFSEMTNGWLLSNVKCQMINFCHSSNRIWDTATRCNTLQHTATHCNTLQHTATQNDCCHSSNRIWEFFVEWGFVNVRVIPQMRELNDMWHFSKERLFSKVK